VRVRRCAHASTCKHARMHALECRRTATPHTHTQTETDLVALVDEAHRGRRKPCLHLAQDGRVDGAGCGCPCHGGQEAAHARACACACASMGRGVPRAAGPFAVVCKRMPNLATTFLIRTAAAVSPFDTNRGFSHARTPAPPHHASPSSSPSSSSSSSSKGSRALPRAARCAAATGVARCGRGRGSACPAPQHHPNHHPAHPQADWRAALRPPAPVAAHLAAPLQPLSWQPGSGRAQRRVCKVLRGHAAHAARGGTRVCLHRPLQRGQVLAHQPHHGQHHPGQGVQAPGCVHFVPLCTCCIQRSMRTTAAAAATCARAHICFVQCIRRRSLPRFHTQMCAPNTPSPRHRQDQVHQPLPHQPQVPPRGLPGLRVSTGCSSFFTFAACTSATSPCPR